MRKTLLEDAIATGIDIHELNKSNQERYQARPENMVRQFYPLEMALALACQRIEELQAPKLEEESEGNAYGEFNPNAMTLIHKGRAAEVIGKEIKLSRISKKGRAVRRLFPVTDDAPFEVALQWVKKAILPKIEA